MNCLRIAGWGSEVLDRLATLDRETVGYLLRIVPSELVGNIDGIEKLQTLPGTLDIDDEAVYFTPRFPFIDDTNYSLLVDTKNVHLTSGIPAISSIARPQHVASSQTEVLGIYPSVTTLPVNQLRFYVHFSSPMSEDWAERSIHIHRGHDDEAIKGAFVEGPELWDREHRRLTLLLDPARIKRGLVPNQELGYPLIENEPVVLRIDSTYRDAFGAPISSSAERRYQVGPSIRAKVDPSSWRYGIPSTGSRDPLRLHFERPLDNALIRNCIGIVGSNGKSISGTASVVPGEIEWQFQPQAPWQHGSHSIIVDPRIEDLAGNSVTRVFDRDLTRPQDDPRERSHVSLEFTCIESNINSPQSQHIETS